MRTRTAGPKAFLVAALVTASLTLGFTIGAAHPCPTPPVLGHQTSMWVPAYDQSIDPAARPHSIWLLSNPRAQDCFTMATMVIADRLASEAVYDPKAPCMLVFGQARA